VQGTIRGDRLEGGICSFASLDVDATVRAVVLNESGATAFARACTGNGVSMVCPSFPFPEGVFHGSYFINDFPRNGTPHKAAVGLTVPATTPRVSGGVTFASAVLVNQVPMFQSSRCRP